MNGTNQYKKPLSWISVTESFGSSLNEDSTNRRIREQFRQNKHSRSSDILKKKSSFDNEIKRYKEPTGIDSPETSPLGTKVTEEHNDKESQVFVTKCIYKVEQNGSKVNEMDSGKIMWIGLPVLDQEKNAFQGREMYEYERDTSKLTFNEKGSSKHRKNIEPTKSSSVQFETSTSSSLTTIMSYHRVRQIFQTIVEKNRHRRRKVRNITEFRNMEELGLGKVHNRRWYPGAEKTLSIWSGLHASLSGVQAQFRKYHKPVIN